MDEPSDTPPTVHAGSQLPLILEMETADPDDFFTLLWLADHPRISLLGVLLTPGGHDQARLVRWGLDQCGASHVPIGVLRGTAWWETPKGRRPFVSRFHARAFGDAVTSYAAGEVQSGPDLLAQLLQSSGATVLVGAPPRTFAQAMVIAPELHVARWVQQGGFAGESLVREPLAKFRGVETCPSWNLGGAIPEVLSLLASARIERRCFVSKNVCHGVQWTPTLRDRVLSNAGVPRSMRRGLQLVVAALDRYSEWHEKPKALHDLVAATCVLDELVCEFTEAELYVEKGAWGARRVSGSGTWISTGFDEERFARLLAE